MAASIAVSASTWNSLKPSNFTTAPDLFSSILVERQALACQGSGFSQGVVSHINTSLSSTSTRLEGLFHLRHFIEQCAVESLNDAALSWIGQLTTILQSYETTAVHKVTCNILATLLSEIRPLTELSHGASTSHVPQVVLALLGAKESWHLPAVQCLTSCMENFPGPCGPFKDKIEKLILPMIIKGVDPEIWKTCAKCYALLPTCGGGGHQSIKHTEAWEAHFGMLLGSLQVTLGDLYQGLEDEDDIPTHGNMLRELEPIDELDENRIRKLTNRFLAICTCLVEMLSKDYGFRLKIPMKTVLNFVCRCLAVNSKFLESRPSTERLLLSTVVSQIHQGALNILETLIHSCRTILLPQSSIVNKLLLQTLSWTQTSDNVARQKTYSSLRQGVYSTLVMWLKACGMLQSMDSFVQSILVDIKPGSETLKLNSKQSNLKDAHDLISNKKKRKKQKGQMSSVGTVSKIAQKGNPELCSQALTALRQILLSAGHCLKTRTLQNVEEFIVLLLSKMQSGVVLPPYSWVSCRMDLYGTLQAMMLVCHGTWQPSVHCIIRLLSAGQRDMNVEVSNYAMESLAVCTALIHPKVPTVYRAPSVAKKDNNSIAIGVTDAQSYSETNISLFMSNGKSGKNSLFQSGSGDAKVFETPIANLNLNRTSLIGTDVNVSGQKGAEKVSPFDRKDADNVMDSAEFKDENESDADVAADDDDDDDEEEEETDDNLNLHGVEDEIEDAEENAGKMQAVEKQTVSKKRKLEENNSTTTDLEPAKKINSSSTEPSISDAPAEIVDSMLMAFVDADADSE